MSSPPLPTASIEYPFISFGEVLDALDKGNLSTSTATSTVDVYRDVYRDIYRDIYKDIYQDI